jgi:hypothetical protein
MKRAFENDGSAKTARIVQVIFGRGASVRAHVISDSAEGIRYPHNRAAEERLDKGMREMFAAS